MEHRAELGWGDVAALAGERLRLPVERHHVDALRHDHLGVEVGAVHPPS